MTGRKELRDRFHSSSFLQLHGQRCRAAFAEAPALRKASRGGAKRRQAQGFSEDHAGPSACYFYTLDLRRCKKN